ncbi:MAG TPA: aminotransferase class V-fold PLP-dependent enzyme [Pseudobdellovibrionaceae bacterium]|nr:aminotransferase class V-fold PLP-dependent enzyme [Pseudobdellovibrionaceae bacterium]
MQNLSSFFKKNSDVINLNSGTLSQSPTSVIEAKFKHFLNYEENTTLSLFTTWQKLWNVQKNFAQFLQANPQDLFFRHNVTEALNELILGVPMEAGEIAYTDLEYGAIINICRLKAQKENLELRKLPLSDYLFSSQLMTTKEAGDEAVSWILKQLKPHTKLLLVSHVMTLNGLILPIEKLAEETNKRGIFLVVDGAHAVGALDLNFNLFKNVSAYAGNLHKWMMAPKGTGFGWLNPHWQNQYQPTSGSWTTFESKSEYSQFGEGSRFALTMLTSHCQDFSSWFAIEETLQFWKQIEASKIRQHINTLKNQIRNDFEALDWICISPLENSWGPLTAFQAPKGLLQKYGSSLTLNLLKELKIQISTPVSPNQEIFLRFSPHIINNPEEISKAQQILKSIL